MRVVADTNVWVSYLILPDSPVVEIMDVVTDQHTVLYSFPVLLELAEVLSRPKFAKYIDAENVRAFVMELIQSGEDIVITTEIDACRDPKDNKFLDLAVCGQADCLLSGDGDLLALNPFRGIPIIRPADFETL